MSEQQPEEAPEQADGEPQMIIATGGLSLPPRGNDDGE